VAGEEIKLKPPELAAKRYYDGTRVGAKYYSVGVTMPKRSPTEAAIAAAEAWHSKVSAAETKEKWVARRKAAGDTKWLFGIMTKGIERYPKGTEIGSVYWMDFYTKFREHLATGLREVYAIQKTDLEAAIKRAETMIRHNAKFRYEPSAISVEEAKRILESIRAVKV